MEFGHFYVYLGFFFFGHVLMYMTETQVRKFVITVALIQQY